MKLQSSLRTLFLMWLQQETPLLPGLMSQEMLRSSSHRADQRNGAGCRSDLRLKYFFWGGSLCHSEPSAISKAALMFLLCCQISLVVSGAREQSKVEESWWCPRQIDLNNR